MWQADFVFPMNLYSREIQPDLDGYQRQSYAKIWTFPGTPDMDVFFDCHSRSIPLLLMGFVYRLQ